MEIDDEANCGTDLDADTAKSTSSTHDSASVITTNNSPTMMGLLTSMRSKISSVKMQYFLMTLS